MYSCLLLHYPGRVPRTATGAERASRLRCVLDGEATLEQAYASYLKEWHRRWKEDGPWRPASQLQFVAVAERVLDELELH